MNSQLHELYRTAGEAVVPAGDVREVLTRAQRRRTATQVATPLATAAVVAGAVAVTASQPWADDASNDVARGGGSEAAGFTASLPGPATVAGNTYTLDDATASAGVPKAAPLEISFQRGTYSAFAGCNTFQGSYDIRDSVLVASGTGSTAAFCPGAERADRWLESFLASGPQVSVDGDRLRLDNGETDVSLAVQQTEDVPLTGTTWELDSLVDGDGASAAVSSVPKDVTSTLRYDGSGAIAVDAGCGSSTARAEVGDDSIAIRGGSTALPAEDCTGASSSVRRTVQTVLDTSVGYEIDGHQLRIQNEDGALVYTAN